MITINNEIDLSSFKEKFKSGFFDDKFTRGLYSTDASIYQMMPYGVLIPKSKSDVIDAIKFSIANKTALLPRGGGTSQCGQTVNHELLSIIQSI